MPIATVALAMQEEKLKKLQGYIGKSSNSAAWKPPLPVKAPDRRRTSVIPSASEGPRQSPLITQARFGHRSAHVRSLLAFASRDDSCENVPLPLERCHTLNYLTA